MVRLFGEILRNGEQPILVLDQRHRAQEERVDRREHRRRSADAERDRQNGDDREAGVLRSIRSAKRKSRIIADVEGRRVRVLARAAIGFSARHATDQVRPQDMRNACARDAPPRRGRTQGRAAVLLLLEPKSAFAISSNRTTTARLIGAPFWFEDYISLS